MSASDLDNVPAARRGRPLPLTAIGYAAGLAILALPLVFGRYGVSLGAEILIFAILAMSLDILLGYTGMPSLGHAAMFGLSAHVVVILGVTYGISPWIGMLAGIVAAAVFAAFVAYLCVQTAGVGFLMLTMAFSQLLYSISTRWRSVTGGSDGIGGLSRPSLLGLSLDNPVTMYLFIAVCFILVYFLLARLVASPLGHAFVGVRENEDRMRAIGYPVKFYKMLAFVIGGSVAGFAGGLYGIFNGFVSPDVLNWSLSGDVLVMVIVGGSGTLIGPAIGAAVLLLAKYLISSYVESWMLVVGLIFIACVIAFRDGIWGTARNLIARSTARSAVKP